jgi:micrococcal nuclease
MRLLSRLLPLVLLAVLVGATTGTAKPPPGGQLARIDHVADGDTVDLSNGQRVRLVQIDTPEVYFAPECYGEQASAITKRLLPPGTLVRLYREPKTDAVDAYGRLLRYVFRVRDGLNVNVYLVRVGAAAPYFYDYRLGRYASRLLRLARRARAHHLGLWGRCPRTPWDPNHGVSTGPP